MDRYLGLDCSMSMQDLQPYQYDLNITTVHSSTINSIGGIQANTQTVSIGTVRYALTHLTAIFHWIFSISTLQHGMSTASDQIGAPHRRTDIAMLNSRRFFCSFAPPEFCIKLLRAATFLSVFSATPSFADGS